MNRLLATLLVCSASIGAAQAADLPFLASPPVSEAAPAVIDAPVDWTGFYAGLNIGYDWGDVSLPHGSGGRARGVLGGGQVGVNYQMGDIVGGFEADIQGVDLHGKSTRFGGVYALRSYIQPLGTARARAGIAVDQMLIYATGGLAYAEVENKLRLFDRHSRDSDVQVGWTVGGGVEYAFDPNWSIKTEYLYADLGSKRYNFSLAGIGIRQMVSYDQHLFRVGLNYKF